MPSAPPSRCRTAPRLLDVGGRPDGVECLVQTEPGIDIARKFIGRGDDRFQRRADEGVAMRLAAGQSARIAAKEWQVRCEFLSKRHFQIHSLNSGVGPIGRTAFCCNPGTDHHALQRASSPGVRSIVGTKHRAFGFHASIGACFRKIDEAQTGDIGAPRRCTRPVSGNWVRNGRRPAGLKACTRARGMRN